MCPNDWAEIVKAAGQWVVAPLCMVAIVWAFLRG